MSEFAVGLTKTVVEGAVSKVMSAIEEEKILKEKVENDLVFITGEFEMMQSVLNVANKERAKNKVLGTWVRQLRDLAFDVEDCVEFVVHLDNNKLAWWWSLLPSCVAPSRPLDDAATQIRQLKARVEDLSQRNTRYNLISDSGLDSKSITVVEQPTPATTNKSAFDVLCEAWEATGKWRGVGDLEKLINSEGGDLQVISVWGNAGAHAELGTTPIFNKVYINSEICQEFKTRAWVKLMTPFNPDEFRKSLLTQVCATSYKANDFCPRMKASVDMEDDLMQQFMGRLRYLVILEGVTTIAEWDVIKTYLPDSKNGSRIIMSTKQLQTALFCAGKPYQVSDFTQFTNHQSLLAFSKKGCRYGRKEASSLFSNRRELLGRQSEAAYYALSHRIVFDHLIKDGSCVISVWGIAGVGKSAVVRNVYSHIMLGLPHHLKAENGERRWRNYEKRYTMSSWVDVPHPLNLADLSSRMLLDFQSDNPQVKENVAVGIMEGQDPIQICRRIMCEEKCLIVIDGLQSKDDWDYIKAAFSPETAKSCIIVITNEASVARHCVDNMERRVVNVKCLEADAALSLFKKVSATELMNSEEKKELSTLIMAKCGGILKVITILGEFLESSKYQLLYALKNINDDFMVKLETQPEFYNLNGLLFWMRRYFEACPDSLKPCIFYLPVFPIDQHFFIRRRRLVRRWIAEGYSWDTSGRTAEEYGEKLFSKLVDLSIVQHHESKGLWQVNGFFHEYIMSRPMEDNHVIALEGHSSLNTQHAGQHLTIRKSWDRDKTVFGGIDFSRLRSLTVFGKWKPFMVSDKMRLVRVLDLENTSKEEGEGVTNDGLKHIVEVLPRLKFLSLRGCKKISRLPDSLGSLRQLQTLDVRKTSIVTLPPATIKLQKMQYIRAGTSCCQQTSTPLEGSDNTILEARDQVQTSNTSLRTRLVSWLPKLHGRFCLDNGGVAVPAGIVNAAALHTLGVVNVSAAAGGKAFLKELHKLTQLRKLGVCGINGENWTEFCDAIVHLESLSLQLEKDNQGFIPNLYDICKPPKTKTLKSLKVYGYVRILPGRVQRFENLKKGNLELVILTQQDGDHLCRCQLFEKSIVRRLMVRCSSGSSLLISGLKELKKLKEVWLQGSYSDQLRQDLQRQIDSHPNEPVLKLEEEH